MPDDNSGARIASGAIATSLARSLARLGSGELADLRRLDPDAAAPAYWRLAAQHDVLARYPDAWIPLVRAMAMLTASVPQSQRSNLHDAERKLGMVLCDGGDANWPRSNTRGGFARPVLSERRLAQLLAAGGGLRQTLLTRAVRVVAQSRSADMGIDVVDLSRAFLQADNAGVIAGPYYRRLDRIRSAKEDMPGMIDDE